jgi:putative flippase GtrA
MFGQFILNPVVLASIVAIVVSMIFSYFPGLRVWFGALKSSIKSLLMIGILVLVSFAVWGAGCLELLSINLTCNKAGLVELVKIFVATILANQATYLVSPIPADVREAKDHR